MSHASREDVGEREFAHVLRAAVQRRGLGLERLRERLQARGASVSVATLSYWQSGRSRPERADSLRALAVLEDILELDDGELRGLLPPPRPRGRLSPPTVERSSLMPSGDVVKSLLGELGVDEAALTRLSLHDIYHLHEDRQTRVQRVRQVHRAESPDARSWPVVHMLVPAPDTPPRITPVQGCVIGAHRERADLGLAVAELVLPRPLDRGDTALTEYEVDVVANGEPWTDLERGLPQRLRELVLEVHFHPADVPSSCVAYTVVDGVEEWWPLRLQGGLAHLMLRDFGPGTCGIRWEW
ncbi:helix-turn-helix domain-containing protein [Ornithinimicrobium tianjinense]|uniref:Uncharacterized protein n=1 Tax=Ornithinimicrobium tianjinense TaxID=1195761 RepID=A0A917BLC9_9MICO|nr:XRE family transcriptional regulator [Ornithinimicrobium tianjinense]GGF50733.1 hypothetical protein GCM10011366_18210 [Ornithinimicrobium tianjinense]